MKIKYKSNQKKARTLREKKRVDTLKRDVRNLNPLVAHLIVNNRDYGKI